jgi:DNA-binding SARP family transcriptional activator
LVVDGRGRLQAYGFHDPICFQTGLWEDVFLDHRVRERSRSVSAARAQRERSCVLNVGGVGGPVDNRVATTLWVLGQLEVVRGGERVRLGSPQQRRLLAVLVVHANEVVSSDRLVDVLWGDGPPRSATHTLQTLLSRLRATLGDDCLETRPPGYRLRVATGEVDALRFEELVRVGLGASDRAEVAVRAFDDALGLWRGLPYAEFASEEFAAAEVARLVELHARAIEERAAALLELGRPEDVIGELEAQIAVEPFRERLRALLMLALARAGRPVESLRAYDEFRRRLTDEVGVVPSPGLHELNDDIVRQHPDVGWDRSRRTQTPHTCRRGPCRSFSPMWRVRRASGTRVRT